MLTNFSSDYCGGAYRRRRHAPLPLAAVLRHAEGSAVFGGVPMLDALANIVMPRSSALRRNAVAAQ